MRWPGLHLAYGLSSNRLPLQPGATDRQRRDAAQCAGDSSVAGRHASKSNACRISTGPAAHIGDAT